MLCHEMGWVGIGDLQISYIPKSLMGKVIAMGYYITHRMAIIWSKYSQR